MAEQLKEFANVALTASNFNSSGEYTVLTNNSTTQAVIKDVNATSTTANSLDSNIILTNGISTIATGGPSTGFELIPQSGTLKVEFNPALSAGVLRNHTVFQATHTNRYYQHTLTKIESQNYPVIAGSTYVAAFTDVSTRATGPAAFVSDNVAWFFVNKAEDRAFYFHYNGNEGTQVYWCTFSSGTFGSWTSFGLGNYQYAALDPETEKFYVQPSVNAVRVFDLNASNPVTYTEFSSAFTGMSPTPAAPSTNAHSATVNGVFFTLPRANYDDRVQYFDPVTSNRGVITRDTNNYLIDTNGFLAITYNPIEKNYYILTKAYSNYKLYYFNVDGVNGALSGDYTSTFLENQSGGFLTLSNSLFAHGTSDGNFVTSNNARKAEISKPSFTALASGDYGEVLHTATSVSGHIATGPVLSKRSTGATIPLSQLKPIGLNLKVSGVEITGVS